jgi:hypothetical protein
MTVVDMPARKKRSRTAQSPVVPLADASGSARFFKRTCQRIQADLGGREHLSCVEGELIRAFAGAATALQYLNVQIALGEFSEVNLTGYAHMASTMLRIGSRLGLSKRTIDVTPPLSEYLQSLKDDDGAEQP